MDILDDYCLFKTYVLEYMSKFPQKFDIIIFKEFNDKGFDIKSEYNDNVVTFSINLSEIDTDIKWCAKMAVLLFLEDYFNVDDRGANEEISSEFNMFCQAVTILIHKEK